VKPDGVSFLINGIGAMGKGLAHQIVATPAARLGGLSDINLGRATACAAWLGLDHRVVRTAREAERAIAEGSVAVAENGSVLADCGAGDVFFEASSAVGAAARLALRAIESGKHVVMMNAEADFGYAPLLARRAEEEGLVYSSVDGDQYGVLQRLADEVSGWGFDIVMFGNIKGFLDRRANPASIVSEADKRKLAYDMCTAYTDGTKLNIEMALIANVHGARPLVPGMHGPRARHVSEVLDLFRLDAQWDGGRPLVDYVLGAEPGGGVFLVGYSGDPYCRDMMRYYKMGGGPFYVFYRPYHLCHVEAVKGALEAIASRRPLMQPVRASTEVVAYAKVPLAAGTELDGIGGYACYGMIETPVETRGLPICLAKGARLNRASAQDERIALADVTFDDTVDWALHEEARVLALGAR
jgi:predicted homoserine dehydrogenase-like protein